MEGIASIRRFGWLVFLFVSSMVLLVFSGNFFLVLLGWDGLGLVSFCLVIFYSNRISLESGLVTVFRNRVGDVFFLLRFFYFFVSGTWSRDFFYNFHSDLFYVFLFLGCITKSAQVPFSSWLPAAIAAPTPVSSLVHSSTLVTAGVYVLIRFNFLFSFLITSFLKVFFVFTMVFAGMVALFELDSKKVVAISTLSQLGMMMFVLSIGMWSFSYVHIIIHAFFKSILFLSVGGTINDLTGCQDSRFFGGSLLNYITFLYFLVRSLCLIGFPFLIGFYSKDSVILAVSLLGNWWLNTLFLIGCFFTVSYRVRLIKIVFRFVFKFSVFKKTEEGYFFVIPVLLLFFNSWILGNLFYWFFLRERILFFCFWDLVSGLIIILAGVMCLILIRWAYFFSVFLRNVFFLRWLTFRGISKSFGKINLFIYDYSWIEFFGGLGVYSLLVKGNLLFNYIRNIRLSVIIIFIILINFIV